jgi:adenosylhomocysteine nucleosidase
VPSDPIAILGAFSDEINMLRDSLNEKQVIETGGIQITRGILHGKDVILAFTGIGKVNAAMTTTILIDHFHPSKIIFTGIAGGLNPALNPTDIVIAEKSVQHDLNYIYNDTLVSYQTASPLNGIINPVYFTCDTQLVRLADSASMHIELEPYVIEGKLYHPKVITGIIATGDAFVASAAKRAEIIRRFHADAVEMEGAAVAQVCYQYNIPVLIIRSISDSADQHADMDIEKFLKVAADNANLLVIQLLEQEGN